MDLNKFIKKFIQDDRFFCSEYLFQQYLEYKKIKVKYSNFDYNLMRFKSHKKVSKSIFKSRKKDLFLTYLTSKMKRSFHEIEFLPLI